MTADEAIKLAEQTKDDLVGIYERIKDEAKQKRYSYILGYRLTDELKDELQSKGFGVAVNYQGAEITTISWYKKASK